MPLRVVAGLPGDCVSQELRDAVTLAARKGHRALVAVPTAPDAVRVRAILALEAPIGVQVATLEGVIESEWALKGDGRRLAKGFGRDVLLARALASAGIEGRPGGGAVALLGALAGLAQGDPPPERCGTEPGDRLLAALAEYGRSLAAHRMLERSDVCDMLSRCGPPAPVIVVDGFVDLPSEAETLLVGWAAAGADVHVAVAHGSGLPGTAASASLVARLKAAGATVVQARASQDSRPAELERIRQELFKGAPPLRGSGAVSLVVTEGQEAEARRIARVAADLIAAGAAPEDIVIAFADPSAHTRWLRRALDDAGIDARFEASVGVRETAFGEALIHLREAASRGLSRDDLSALVRSPFSGVRPERADATDATWRRRGMRQGRELLKHVAPLDPLVTEAVGLLAAPIGSLEAHKWKKLVDRMLVNGNPGTAPVTSADALADAAVQRDFCRRLQESIELGEGEVSADELWDSFASARVALRTAGRAGRVLVTGIAAFAFDAYPHVVIGGLTASEFPRRGSEDRLEGDAISRVMDGLGIALDPDEHGRKERRSFYLAATAANRSLTLVRCGSDDEGAPLRESVFWDEFLDLYRRPGERMPTDGLPRIERVRSDPAALRGSRPVARGALTGDAGLAELAAISEVSPSEIESYLSCPYKWFIERRIKAEALDAALDAAAPGRLAHAALAGFYREWLGLDLGRITPETLHRATEMARRIATASIAGERGAETLEGVAMLESIVPSVVGLVERDVAFLPEFVPAYVEWSFGRASDVPAFDLGGVMLVGRADRVDVGAQGLVVVDYKRTNATPLAHIRDDGLVQLQLYAAAASHHLGVPIAGGLYRSLADGADRGFVLEGVAGALKANDVMDRRALDALVAGSVGTALDATSRMRAGRIEPTPSTRACGYCAAANFCPRAVPA